MTTISIILIIAIIILIFVTIIGSINWSVHKDQVKTFTSNYGYGSYKNFKNEFMKYTWNNEGYSNCNSYWDRKYDCELHAGVYKFNGIGMIMRTPLDYYLAYIYINKYKNNTKNCTLYNWNKPNKTINVKDVINNVKAEEIAKEAYKNLKNEFPDIKYEDILLTVKNKI